VITEDPGPDDLPELIRRIREAASTAALSAARDAGVTPRGALITTAAYCLIHVGVELWLATRSREALAKWLRTTADDLESRNDDGRHDA
jgi:hypothetical protein